MRRPGDPFDMLALEAKIPGITDKVTFIDAPLQNLSSSNLRRRIVNGEMYRYYLFPPVYDYIESKRLYQGLITKRAG
jgi:nicotinate-nucleotide adenylyltransferase